MTTTTKFDLNNEIRVALANAGVNPSYDLVAKNVVASIPAAEIPDVLLLLVRRLVQFRNMQDRRSALRATAVSKTCVAKAKQVLPPAGTPRWQRSVPAWQKLLNTNVNIGGGSMPKRLGSCTAAEILIVATTRFDQSSALTAEGTRFEKLHDVMLVEGAATPDDLSQATLVRFAQGWP